MDKIPNGHNVPHPCILGGSGRGEGQIDPKGLWRGVGHINPKGSGTLNPFGDDFAAQGHVS